MVSPDPVRALRGIYSRELQDLIRTARGEAVTHIREHFKYRREIDVEQIRRILEKIFARRGGVTDRGREVIARNTRNAYLRGVDRTLSALQYAQRPADVGLSLSARFDMVDEQAVKNLANMQFTELEGITSEISEKLVRHLVEADKQGSGITKISRIISDDFRDIGLVRVEALARTSLNNAYNDAAWTRIQKYAPYKEWLRTHDDRTRPGHAKMEGVIIETDELFHVPAFLPTPKSRKQVPEAWMYFPGDVSQNPPLAQRINCRCTIAPRFVKR